jgi:MoCo/4Fe-4S cofactor protein with predicted Tat translocation signal
MSDHEEKAASYDLEALRTRVTGTSGREYWRGLEQLADSEEFQRFLKAEFPAPLAVLDTPVSRRGFLRVMGASLALAGLNACTRQPTEKIVPYVKQPEQIVPGEPLYFASAFVLGGYATGVLVESHLGRPTKVEGNPEHPSSRGATDSLAQASLLDLYDPDRSQVVSLAGEIRPWSAFVEAMSEERKELARTGGKGLRILTETVTSPTLAAQLRDIQVRYPKARWHQYEAVNDDSARRAAVIAFGENVDTRYALEKADVIVSLDADFLGHGPARVRLAREFADRRRVSAADTARADMNRLYAIEPTLSTTGAKADHRLRLSAGDVEAFARHLAVRLGLPGGMDSHEAPYRDWLGALVRDLKAHRGRSAVIPGALQSPAVHVLAHAINRALDNVGATVFYTEPVVAEPVVQMESLSRLVAEMKAEQVSTLLILGGNPRHTAPTDLAFARALAKVKTTVHLTTDFDETSQACTWHVAQAHTLESWGDARSEDGTATIIQPLVEPLYDGRTTHELLALLLEDGPKGAYDIVRSHWQAHRQAAGTSGSEGQDFEAFWRKSLHDGVVAGTAARARDVALNEDWQSRIAPLSTLVPGERSVEVDVRPDAHLYDGRFANNAWLQELPKPVTLLTWDNAICLSPVLAAELGVENGRVLEVTAAGKIVRGPAWILPGQAERTVTVTVGYGRWKVGRVGKKVGFNAYPFRTERSPWRAIGEIRVMDETRELATTQSHGSMEGRHVVREGTLERFRKKPDFVREFEHIPTEGTSMFPEHPYEGYAWGMVIDLAACIGCNACTIACQAENNIAVVGKEQVLNGREMHWIRVDRYFEGSLDDPSVVHQPVPCMHCENAPCELVCPVNATVHDDEGLNAMVYNRCVGTRYCANNCPYKVRRYNFLLYSDWETEQLKLGRNPDVTVRSRGVMEKCSYCTQRINEVRIEAKRDDRSIRDGEIETACQQACPAEAISFGDLNDAESKVSRARKDPRNYSLLGELGTKPRTTYLAALRNPNPEITPEADDHDDQGGHG